MLLLFELLTGLSKVSRLGGLRVGDTIPRPEYLLPDLRVAGHREFLAGKLFVEEAEHVRTVSLFGLEDHRVHDKLVKVLSTFALGDCLLTLFHEVAPKSIVVHGAFRTALLLGAHNGIRQYRAGGGLGLGLEGCVSVPAKGIVSTGRKLVEVGREA